MNFLRDLLRWFMWGERRKNMPSLQPEINEIKIERPEPASPPPVPVIPEVKAPPTKYQSPTFDFLKDNPSSDFLIDLQSIRPLAEQFDRAREDLLKELQRLAPPKKRIFDLFNKKAA